MRERQIPTEQLFNNKKNPSKPTAVADNPVGQWNTFWVKVEGEKVWIKLNGKLVVDGVTLENYWDRTKPLIPTGDIQLWFRKSQTRFQSYAGQRYAETA